MMSTVRNQVITQLCTLLGAKRAFKYSGQDSLPVRAVFDENEQTQMVSFGEIQAVLSVRIECILDGTDAVAPGENEGDALDREVSDVIETLYKADYSFGGLADAVTVQAVNYKYSDMGESLIAVSIELAISYSYLKTNLSIKP